MQKSSGSNNQDVKQKNRMLVLKLITVNKGVSRVDIAKMTGLSKMTVGNIVTELIEQGIVTEKNLSDNPFPQNNGNYGRKPIMLTLSPDSPCICGMLIKRELCQIVIGDLSGTILEQINYEFSSLENGDALIDMLMQGFQTLTARIERPILAISIASLGPLNSSDGIILNPPYFYGIENFPITSIIHKITGLPTFLVNDANAGALAEKLYGIGKDIPNFTYLHIMNGIGSGLVLKDSLYEGDTGQSGEIGHTSINFAGPQCACGIKGCLDLYANVDNMRQKVFELSPFYPASPLASVSHPTWHDIVDCANRKDALAIIVIEEFCSYVSYALINTLNLLNIATLIVGYDSSLNGFIIEDIIKNKLSRTLLSANYDDITVIHSKFNGNAPLIGSIAFIADKIFSLNLSLFK